ncbi:MAG: NADH-quinone oxidoreductase subunit L, partial [Chloroflexi bacterium]|nr:NADH-quinone oxidoreductase subunit L [Chloroflexota bacterium]
MGMEHVWLLPAIPAVLFALMGLFNGLVPRRGDFIVILGMAVVVVLSFLVLLDFQGSFKDGHFAPGDSNLYSFSWVEIDTGVVDDLLLIEFSTFVDGITVLMLAVVSIVTLMVMIYSVGYMRGEVRYGWYFAVLSGFGAAMLMLVVSGNLLLLYLSWEAVGLASYLLIGFYWERQTAAEAAKKAFITTRIGDV